MLGEKISDEIGQVTSTRVLPSEGAPRVEVSFEGAGTVLGRHMKDIGTYIAVARPDGTLFGDGQGIMMTEDGETVTWTGQGVGRFTGRGSAIAWRGAIYCQTAAERLARLNGTALVFEYEVDESEKTESRLFEWK